MAQGQSQLMEAKLGVAASVDLRRQALQAQTSAVFSFANTYRRNADACTSRVQMADSPGMRPPEKRKRVLYENTYRTTPEKAFPSCKVQGIIRDVIDSNMKHETYDVESCRQNSQTLAEMIKMRVKDLSIPRYKIICLVHIGQITGQGVRIASQCLWNPEFDSFAEYSFKNSSLFATGLVYGVYCE